jgi:hypothetical protein
MSAMLVEQQVTTPVTSRPRWRHVPQPRGPIARQNHPGSPGGRPVSAPVPMIRTCAAPAVVQPTWQLTRRGLKAAIALFVGMFALATITLAGAFFSVSNDPIEPSTGPFAAIGQG